MQRHTRHFFLAQRACGPHTPSTTFDRGSGQVRSRTGSTALVAIATFALSFWKFAVVVGYITPGLALDATPASAIFVKEGSEGGCGGGL